MHPNFFNGRSLGATLTVASLAFLFTGRAAVAGTQHPGAIRMNIAEASPDKSGVFTCETRFFDRSKNPRRGVACYAPDTIRKAYGLTPLISGGNTGAGQTIVILDAFGSPTALKDLKTFDRLFGIADPPSFKVVTMPGTPPFDFNNGNQLGWSDETSLDVQWSHAMAPGANIVLVQAASDSDDDLVAGLNFALDNHLGNVVSMSFGESEFFLTDKAGQQTVAAWERAFKKARHEHVTLFVSSGDQGSTNTADGAGNVLPFQNASYPASSPQVTGVGGTNLQFGKDGHADPAGSYLGETVWNDEAQGIQAAGGGGVSAIFKTPGFQEDLSDAVSESLHGHRGVPDVAYNAGVVGGVPVVIGTFAPPAQFVFVFGGTSAGAPQWAGVIADVNQLVGRPAGFINNRLYKVGESGALAGLFHDVTVGDNTYCGGTTPNGVPACIAGFAAAPGYDLVTGWGTPNFGTLGTVLSDPDNSEGND